MGMLAMSRGHQEALKWHLITVIDYINEYSYENIGNINQSLLRDIKKFLDRGTDE